MANLLRAAESDGMAGATTCVARFARESKVPLPPVTTNAFSFLEPVVTLDDNLTVTVVYIALLDTVLSRSPN